MSNATTVCGGAQGIIIAVDENSMQDQRNPLEIGANNDAIMLGIKLGYCVQRW